MNASDMACVVLASGLSERFGDQDKLSIDLCGKPLFGYVLNAAEDIGFGEIYVVSDRVRQGKFTWVQNDAPMKGQGHSLRLGLRKAKEDGWQTVVIVLGDMPLVSEVNLKDVIDKKYINQSVVSITESIRMPPAKFLMPEIDLILSQSSKLGAKAIFQKTDFATVPIEAEVALDVDTQADLDRVAAIIEARPK